MKLHDADLTVTSDDVTILGVTVTPGTPSSAPSVVLEPKKAGKVKLTVKSGTTTKVIDLEVVDAERKLTTGTLLSASPKVVDTVNERTVRIALKDQFGEAFNTDNIDSMDGISIVQATHNGVALTNVEQADINAVSGKSGTADVKITFTNKVGTGNLVLQLDSKDIVRIPVSVIAPTTAESFNLAASATKIDLNPNSSDDEITFTLEKLLSGHYSEDEDLTKYLVEVLDADGTVIFKKSPGPGAKVKVTRADLLVEDAGKAELGQADSKVTAEHVISNGETGRGLIKIYKTTGELVKTANFNIVDTAANINAVTLANIDFTSTNNTTLNLGQFLTKVGTTATEHDSVLRYEVLSDPTKVAVFYDADPNAPTAAAYSYDDGDVLVGIVQATVVKSAGGGKFEFKASSAPFTADTITINAPAMAAKGDQVQFNVINRGDKTIAKKIYNFVVQN